MCESHSPRFDEVSQSQPYVTGRNVADWDFGNVFHYHMQSLMLLPKSTKCGLISMIGYKTLKTCLNFSVHSDHNAACPSCK